jgi:hypothetical protein
MGEVGSIDASRSNTISDCLKDYQYGLKDDSSALLLGIASWSRG